MIKKMEKTNRKANSVSWERGAKILNLVSSYYFQVLQWLNFIQNFSAIWAGKVNLESKCIN